MIFVINIFIVFLQASKDVGNFYASWDLAEVATTVNLVALVCHLTGLGLDAPVRKLSCINSTCYWLFQDAGYTNASYSALISEVLEQIDLLSKWSTG